MNLIVNNKYYELITYEANGESLTLSVKINPDDISSLFSDLLNYNFGLTDDASLTNLSEYSLLKSATTIFTDDGCQLNVYLEKPSIEDRVEVIQDNFEILGGSENVNELRSLLESVTENMSDEQIQSFPNFVEEWKENVTYFVGKRLNYQGTLYKVIQNHTSQSDWTPDVAVSLFTKVLAGQEGTDIGEWVQPDSTNPYMKGDKVTYKGKTYESTIDNNVWAPDVYGWNEVQS